MYINKHASNYQCLQHLFEIDGYCQGCISLASDSWFLHLISCTVLESYLCLYYVFAMTHNVAVWHTVKVPCQGKEWQLRLQEYINSNSNVRSSSLFPSNPTSTLLCKMGTQDISSHLFKQPLHDCYIYQRIITNYKLICLYWVSS